MTHEFIYILLLLVLPLATMSTRCSHHKSCLDCVRSSEGTLCQWATFGARKGAEGSGGELRPRTCHTHAKSTFHGKTAKMFPAPHVDFWATPLGAMSGGLGWIERVEDCPASGLTVEHIQALKGKHSLFALSYLQEHIEPKPETPRLIKSLIHYILNTESSRGMPSLTSFEPFARYNYILRPQDVKDARERSRYGYFSLSYGDMAMFRKLRYYTQTTSESSRERLKYRRVLDAAWIFRSALKEISDTVRGTPSSDGGNPRNLGIWPRDLFWRHPDEFSDYDKSDYEYRVHRNAIPYIEGRIGWSADSHDKDKDVGILDIVREDGDHVVLGLDRQSVLRRLLRRYENHIRGMEKTYGFGGRDQETKDEGMNGEETKTSINTNANVRLPLWYHATSLSNAKEIIRSGRIDAEKSGYQNNRLGPGVYLSTIPEMRSSYGDDDYGKIGIAVSEKRENFRFNNEDSFFTLDKETARSWGVFKSIPVNGFAYLIFDDRPEIRRNAEMEGVWFQNVKDAGIIALSESLLEREVLRASVFLAPTLTGPQLDPEDWRERENQRDLGMSRVVVRDKDGTHYVGTNVADGNEANVPLSSIQSAKVGAHGLYLSQVKRRSEYSELMGGSHFFYQERDTQEGQRAFRRAERNRQASLADQLERERTIARDKYFASIENVDLDTPSAAVDEKDVSVLVGDE